MLCCSFGLLDFRNPLLVYHVQVGSVGNDNVNSGHGHPRGESQRVLRLQLMSRHEDAGMESESVEYMLKEIKLLRLRIATQKLEGEIGLAEEALGRCMQRSPA